MMDFIKSRRMAALITCVVLSSFVIGCGSGADGIISPIAHDGIITIEITKSTEPEFRWSAGIAVQTIRVMSFSSSGQVDQILWGYTNASILPPVQYGEILPGGLSLVPVGTAQPLRSGNRYRVQVVRSGQSSHTDWIVP